MNNDRLVAAETAKVTPVVPMEIRELLGVAGVGAGVGLVTYGAFTLLERFVFHAVMCRADTAANCGDAPTYAMVVAMVLGGLAGLVALVQLRIYRPLLVVLAAVISLWGYEFLVAGMAWYWAFGLSIALFAVIYALFAWLARVRSFLISVIAIVVMIAILRLVLTA